MFIRGFFGRSIRLHEFLEVILRCSVGLRGGEAFQEIPESFMEFQRAISAFCAVPGMFHGVPVDFMEFPEPRVFNELQWVPGVFQGCSKGVPERFVGFLGGSMGLRSVSGVFMRFQECSRGVSGSFREFQRSRRFSRVSGAFLGISGVFQGRPTMFGRQSDKCTSQQFYCLL